MATALIVGSTGLVGGHLLDLLLEDSHYSKVVSLVRKETGREHQKLEELVVSFARLNEPDHTPKLPQVDDVYCCLGTTMKQVDGSKQLFEEIDRQYPLNVAALAQKDLEKKLPANLSAEDPTLVGKETKAVVEVDLGEYSITVSQPNTSTALRVDFHLYGTVLEGDQTELTSLLDRNVHRFRDQVLYEIRNSESSDLADPGLALIKRRILEKSNALFDSPILRSVVFSQFSYIEQ